MHSSVRLYLFIIYEYQLGAELPVLIPQQWIENVLEIIPSPIQILSGAIYTVVILPDISILCSELHSSLFTWHGQCKFTVMLLWVPRAHSREIKRPEHEADYSPI